MPPASIATSLPAVSAIDSRARTARVSHSTAIVPFARTSSAALSICTLSPSGASTICKHTWPPGATISNTSPPGLSSVRTP